MILIDWFMEATKGEKLDVVVASLQLLATCLRGGFALYLFKKSNKETNFISDISERLYDESISKGVYAADKEQGRNKLHEKLLCI